MRWMKRLVRPITFLLTVSTALYGPMAISLSAAPLAPRIGEEPPGGGEFNPEELLEVQADAFEKLFAHPFDANEWTYPLEKQVTGEGEYAGTNHLGQKFTLNVITTVATDLTKLEGVSDKEREWAIKHGFAYQGVIGTLSTELATIPVLGLSVYQSNDIIAHDSRFILVNVMDEGNALFSPAVAPAPVEVASGYGWWPIFIPKFCLDASCVEDCWEDWDDCFNDALDDYTQAVNAANAAYSTAETLAKTTRDLTINAAHGTFNTAKAAAHSTLAIELTACTAALTAAHIGCAFVTVVAWWTGGAATLACILIADAAYAGCMAVATLIYNNDVRAAEAARDLAINAANGIYQAEMAAAKATRDQALADAKTDFNQAVDECNETLDDCLGDCPWVICGWTVVWIWLPI